MSRFTNRKRAVTVVSLFHLIPLISIFQWSGCKVAKVANAELGKNRQLWQQNNIENYSFTCERVIGGTFSYVPEQIEVRERKVISRATIDMSEQYNSYDCCSDIETVEKIFDLIKKSYDEGKTVKVTYNEKFGFPENSIIDDRRGADTLFAVKVTNLKVKYDNLSDHDLAKDGRL